MILKLIQLVISKAEAGLWYDHDKKSFDQSGWGICLKLFAGTFVRPVAKFWKKGANPWKGDHWFVIRLPIVILPFLSIALFNWGAYIGGKVFHVDSDEPWAKPSEYGKDMLTVSFTTRATRWK